MKEYKEPEYTFDLEEAYKTGRWPVYQSYIDDNSSFPTGGLIRLENILKRQYNPVSENILEAIIMLVDSDCIETNNHGLSQKKILSFTNKYGLLFPEIAAKRHPRFGRHAVQPHPRFLNDINEIVQNFRKNVLEVWQLVSMYESQNPKFWLENNKVKEFKPSPLSVADVKSFWGDPKAVKLDRKLLSNKQLLKQSEQEVYIGHMSLSDTESTTEKIFQYILYKVNSHFDQGNVFPIIKKNNDRLELSYHPETLLDVAYIQLAHLIIEQREAKPCEICWRLMVRSKGSHSDKETHTNCRVKKNMAEMRERKKKQKSNTEKKLEIES